MRPAYQYRRRKRGTLRIDVTFSGMNKLFRTLTIENKPNDINAGQTADDDANFLLSNLSHGTGPDPRKLFKVAMHYRGVAKKSPLVHGITTDDENLDIDHEQLLEALGDPCCNAE